MLLSAALWASSRGLGDICTACSAFYKFTHIATTYFVAVKTKSFPAQKSGVNLISISDHPLSAS